MEENLYRGQIEGGEKCRCRMHEIPTAANAPFRKILKAPLVACSEHHPAKLPLSVLYNSDMGRITVRPCRPQGLSRLLNCLA